MSHVMERTSWRAATVATLHCLVGCAVGEVLGLVLGTALGLGNGGTVALSVGLAFLFGYGLTMRGAMDAGLAHPLFWGALALALTVAFVVTVPVNRAMMSRGRGHLHGHVHHPSSHGGPSVP